MINHLKEILKTVKAEKAAAMKPYNNRIRTIKSAINSLNSFTESTEAIKSTELEIVELPTEQTEEA